MIIINEVECHTIDEVEAQIIDLSPYQQECLRNEFYGISNAVKTVSPRQIRIALISSGITLDTIETMIDSLPEPQKSVTRVTWEYSVEFQRSNPLLAALAPSLGLTDEQVDDIFRLAATL